MIEIKVGFCVAYDWRLLRHALPAVYNQSDVICLSLDENRTSWSGHHYSFDEHGFRLLVNTLDVDGKIKVVEDNYHLQELSPMQNEVRQRNELARHMGPGGWHIQLDCDEYFLDFAKFVGYLRSLPKWKTKKANICCPWFVLFKEVKNGYLYIDPIVPEKIEYMQIATLEPYYEYGRRNGNFNIYTNYLLIHQSWARDPEEIKSKILNWGHSDDFNRDQYFDFWKALDQTNYEQVSDFHWLKPSAWPRLGYLIASSIEELLRTSGRIQYPHLSSFSRLVKNSKNLSRLRKLITLAYGKN